MLPVLKQILLMTKPKRKAIPYKTGGTDAA